MFWRFGGYANISTIDTILEKPDFRLEDLLEESDLIQELKQHNAKLVEYLREPKILEKLLEYVVAPELAPVATPDEEEDEAEGAGKGRALPFSRPRASSRTTDSGREEEEGEKKRNRYAYVAAEVLSSDNWSIYEALMDNKPLLRSFWQFLQRPVPLDPLQASYFTKVNESLFDKKTEEMLELLKSLDNAVPDMLRHVDCPMIMDLLLKIISLERTESGQGVVEWLYTQRVMPTLLSFLGPEHSWATQTSAGDFMKAIITVSANASQNEQTCIGPNELTRQLVSRPCVDQLIGYMLGGGNPLTVGVGIVIEVIRKNNSDYDPDVGTESNSLPSSRDPIYLGTLLRLFAQHVPDFMHLVLNAPAQKERLDSTFGEKIEPLGFDRFKTCELMAELLHCSNMALLNEVGAEEVIATRDAERQRMRNEGRLTAQRGEEIPASHEDLTMRVPHPPAQDEGRRLEVMNISAEDDGFEEVTHSGDMGEDASADFVKAEGELTPTGPKAPSPYLDKDDDDDFVDEPLSSPRLNVRDDDLDEPQFEEPELVVAPLSPTKSKPTESDAEKKEQGDLPAEPPSAEIVTEDKGESHQATHKEQEQESAASEKSDASSDAPVLTPIALEPDVSHPKDPHTGAEVQTTSTESSREVLSPHPEDTPAPLFSGKPAAPEQEPVSEVADVRNEAADFPPQTHSPDQSPITSFKEAEPGEASVIIGQAGDAATEDCTSIEDSEVTPVVGDYLKMQFVEYRVVPTILSFFFAYPWNNFLHNVVYDIVQQVFNGPMDRGFNPNLAVSLFEAANIITQIVQGQQASERSQQTNKTRMGYMGHLTLIAEEVVKFTERHPPELLSEVVLDRVMTPEWTTYVEGALAETRERDNAILGGVRPEVALNNRAGAGAGSLGSAGLSGLGSALGLTGAQVASNALAEAGLNGGLDLNEGASGNGIGPFAISAGTLMSGFGSSSDEEDEEEQEQEQDTEEDVNNEFRAYNDPLTASSLAPPSIPPPPPPPPPPLNIPPSRARLQFAARLAMNKRNAQAAMPAASGGEAENGGDETLDPDAASGSGETGDSLSGFSILKRLQAPSEIRPQKLRNPFEADEDEDEDDEEDVEREGSGGSDDGNGEGEAAGGDTTRGNWWRGALRRVPKSGNAGGASRHSRGRGSVGRMERFGDGRDDSDSSGEEDALGLGLGNGAGEVGDEDDDEFGDFAMPEVADAPQDGQIRAAASDSVGNGMRSGGDQDSSQSKSGPSISVSEFDPSREKVLLKPLPVHPSPGAKPASTAFSSIWPWSAQGFGTAAASGSSTATSASSAPNPASTSKPAPGKSDTDEAELVLAEDGSRVSRTVEAKRRTSIEDPDDEEEEEQGAHGDPGEHHVVTGDEGEMVVLGTQSE